MKKKGEEGGGGMPVVTLIGIIVLVVLLFIVLGSLAKGDYPNWVKNALPWLTVDNSTVQRTPDCPNIVAEIGKTEGSILEGAVGQREQYLYINGQKTNLYWSAVSDSSNKKLKGKVWLNIPGGGNDIEIGSVYREDVSNSDKLYFEEGFISEYSVSQYRKTFKQYKNYLPDFYYMVLLHGAFKYRDKNYLCKYDDEVSLAQERACFETCSLYDGKCKPTGKCNILDDGVSYGKLDCKEGDECCVKRNGEKLQEGDLFIRNITFWDSKSRRLSYYTNLFYESEDAGISVIPYEKYVFSGAIYSNKSFCYIIRTNREVLGKDVAPEGWVAGYPPLSFQTKWTPGSEWNFAFVVWIPKDMRKVFKIVGVHVVDTAQTEAENFRALFLNNGGNVPDDKFWEFAKDLKDLDPEERETALEKNRFFYVNLHKPIKVRNGGDRLISRFMVTKIIGSKEFEIYALYEKGVDYKGQKLMTWNHLDCYTGFGGGFYTDISINKIGYSLSETVLNNCKWGWS